LFETCPKGLGTPNAACGEGELMLILASPKLKKPSKNDIQVENGEVFNLKNDKPRVFAGTDGKTLNKIMMNIAEKIGLKPQTHNGKKSIQLVNENFIINDWNKQFKKIEKSKIIDFLSIFLINLFPEKRLDDKYVNNLVTDCLNGNELVWDKWNKLLTVFIFEHGNDRDENLLSIKLDGTVKVIPNRVEIFKELVLMGRIIFDSGYFRMFQNGKVGIYIKFSDI
jgi:hypothetical protein